MAQHSGVGVGGGVLGRAILGLHFFPTQIVYFFLAFFFSLTKIINPDLKKIPPLSLRLYLSDGKKGLHVSAEGGG